MYQIEVTQWTNGVPGIIRTITVEATDDAGAIDALRGLGHASQYDSSCCAHLRRGNVGLATLNIIGRLDTAAYRWWITEALPHPHPTAGTRARGVGTMNTITTREIQPDIWEVWSHVTGDGNDYHERIGRITKLAPRAYAPATLRGYMDNYAKSKAEAVALLIDAYTAGEPAYRP